MPVIRTLRPFGAPPTAIVAAFALATVVSACARGDTALKQAMVKLDVAIEKGSTLSEFDSALLDAETQFALARSKLGPDESSAIEGGLEAASAARTIWQSSFDSGCPERCGAPLYRSMKTLGLIKTAEDFSYEKEIFSSTPSMTEIMGKIRCARTGRRSLKEL